MKLLRIKLPDQLHARLKVQAAVWGGSMQNIAVGAIEEAVHTAEITAKSQANPRPSVQNERAR